MTAHAQAFKTSAWARAGWIARVLYIVYAAARVEITWARFMVGLDNGAKFIGRMLPQQIARGRNYRGRSEVPIRNSSTARAH